MPPAKKDEKEVMAIFSLPGQLGAVGTAFMCAAVDEADGFVDAATLEDMEGLIDKEELKKGIMKGTHGPCHEEDIARLFPTKEEVEKKK